MGYSHYWDLNRIPENYNVQKARAFMEIQALLNRLPETTKIAGGYFKNDPLKICGGSGTGKPVITKDLICFNGDSRTRLDYETFYFDFKSTDPTRGFCKTARKPYDLAVCITLMSLANHITGFEFGSDGGQDDWQEAIDMYYRYCGSNISENLNSLISKL